MGAAHSPDPLTRWWRGISLRSKITGVTVGVLALGLLVAGVSTVPFLRGAFIGQIDESLHQQMSNEALPDQLFLVETEGDRTTITNQPNLLASSTPYTALYDSQGKLVLTITPSSSVVPQYPDNMRPDKELNRTGAFSLPSSDGQTDTFRAVTRIVTLRVDGEQSFYVMLIAAPTRDVERNITTYLAIFGMLATLTLVLGAFLTRWLVTLAFRRLTQVESTAMAIAAGNFTQRMPDAEPRTEVGRLKLAINTMLTRLDAALAQRDASVAQMRRFVGDASHELRTPLVTMRGYAELYRMGAIRDDEAVTQAMDRIEKEAIRMGNLVEDLLALARLDEKREVVFSPIDLRPIARDAALDLRAVAPERTSTYVDATIDLVTVMPSDAGELPQPEQRKRNAGTAALNLAGATIGRLARRRKPTTGESAAEAAPATPPKPTAALTQAPPPVVEPRLPIVLGEEDKIRQVVSNLLGNARRYTPNDSPIEIAVGVDESDEYGWIAVIDHGEGIPEQQREQIFQRFWRADTSRTRETGGSGLGLAIVASIVQSMHGHIAVDETPGGGATFRVCIPLSHQRTPEEHLSIPTQPIQRLRLDANGNPLRPE